MLFATIAAVHAAAIWLLLQPGAMPLSRSKQPLLALFDVALPAPLPEPPPPPPPLPENERNRGGGSPGIRRERAAAMVEAPAPPAREAMDATFAPIAPLPLPALAAGTAPIDLGLGGMSGIGTGSGSGTGSRDGSGRGEGDGETDAYARADWIERPSKAAWHRNWPRDVRSLSRTVTIKMTCKVRRSGRPYDCRLRSEDPPRLGFGATALAVVRDTRIRPVGRNSDAQWQVPVIITLVIDPLEIAPRIPAISAASAPRAR